MIAPHAQPITSPTKGISRCQFWLNFGLGLLTAITPGLVPMPALAQNLQVEPATFPVRFYCSRSRRGTYITYAETAEKTVVFIDWQRYLRQEPSFRFDQHCQQVSDRLQTYISQGQLNYITVGIMNGERVACAAPRYEGRCQGLLWILRSGEDASRVLIRTFNVPSPTHPYEPESWPPRYLYVREILSRAPLAEGDLAPEVKAVERGLTKGRPGVDDRP